MSEPLLHYWIALKQFFAYPSISAASAAMLMATLKIVGTARYTLQKWAEVPMVGVASYTLVPISVGLGMDPSWASGVGAFVGYMGMVELESRVDGLLRLRGKGGEEKKNRK